MAQLIVRNLEERVVAVLRQRAARRGVSMEEEHRTILRAALVAGGGTQKTLKVHLASMPDVGGDGVFARPRSTVRRVRL